MGGVEKVLCQYLYEMRRTTDYDISVLSYKKVKDKYFLDFFEDNKIKLYNNFFRINENYSSNSFKRLFQKILNLFFRTINFYHIDLILNKNDVLIDFKNYSFNEIFSKTKKKKLAWCHGSSIFFENVCVNSLAYHDIYDKYIFLTKSLLNELDLIAPFLKKRALYIYNPINIEQLGILSQQKFDLPYKCDNFFLAIQRIDKRDKNLDTVIDAFYSFLQSYNNTCLLIIGDGPDKKDYEDNNKSEKIIFLGQINNPYPLIKKSLGVILSSKKNVGEGLSNVIIETQALKSLIIAADVKSCAREILLDGSAGLLFEAENSNSLLDALVFRMNNKEVCLKKQERGFKEINRFAPEICVRKLISVLESM